MNRRMRIGAAVVLAALVATMAGCATAEKDYRLRVATEAYDKSIRWGNFPRAISLMHVDARPSESQLGFILERFKQVQVTGYSLQSQEITADPDELVRIMELRLVNRHTLRERTMIDRQLWWYDRDQLLWLQMSGLPDIARR
ncbi:MAG: hypothetical protein AAGE01_09380 [Pseudomonadota bacterium]